MTRDFPAHDYDAKLEEVKNTVQELLTARGLDSLYCEDFIETEFLDRNRYWLNSYLIGIQIFDHLMFFVTFQISTDDEY